MATLTDESGRHRAARERPYAMLGARVKALRLRADLTQEELARQVGINKGYPPRIEAGLVAPSAQVLRRIATVIGADYNDLAVLAGYADINDGTEIIRTTPEKAASLRRLSRYPAEAIDRFERFMADVFLLRDDDDDDPPSGR